jgi:hypothetical protein
MIKSLPTIEKDPYTLERSANDAKIAQIFSQLFPDTPVPYEYIFDMVRLLEQTKVNARILPEVIRGIYNLRMSDHRGQVIVHINAELTNVQIRENSETMSTLIDDIEK